MVLLPVRTAVLAYLNKTQDADVTEMMKALERLYGQEKQFTRARFVDHVMSLEANGLVEEVGYELDTHGELSVRYRINSEGVSAVKKYVSAEAQKTI